MVTAVTKFLFPTVAHAMAHPKMRGVKMVAAKITGAANLGATNNAAIIAAVTTVAAKQALATNVGGHRSQAESPESTANVRATMVQSQLVLVGIRML